MTKIPKRPDKDDFVFSLGGEIAMRLYEHAVAVALYEWAFDADCDDGCGRLNETDAPPCSHCKLFDDIEANEWKPDE